MAYSAISVTVEPSIVKLSFQFYAAEFITVGSQVTERIEIEQKRRGFGRRE